MQEFATRKAIARRMDLRLLNCLLRKYRVAVRIMKLTAILLAACLQLSARGLTQTVTISVKDAPLLTVLKAIKKQTGFVFFINSDEIKRAKNVSITANNLPLQQVLDMCFKDQPLTYTITGRLINVIPRIQQTDKINDKTNFTTPLPASIDVSGKVMDENGGPLAGANVVEKGKQHGTTTNVDGVFVLKGVDDKGSLEISFVGYQTLTVPINNRTSIIVSIKQSDANLQEVVVNKGYYTELKKFSTGNSATVTSKEIEQQPVQNPLLALQGRVPGIEITQLTGLSGGGVNVKVQGTNTLRFASIGTTDPLIVIDGVPYPSQLYNNGREGLLQGGSPLNYINPNDIESITVLKDADATSIYGSRAGNGAILITTKKGKIGKPKLSVDLQQGWGKVTRHVDMMNTRQYLDMRNEAFKNDGLSPNPAADYDLTLWDTTRYTNWQKTLIGGTAKYTTINTSISGGTTMMQYLIGGTYHKQTTVFPGDFDDKSGGLHFNINSSSVNQKLHIQLSGSYMYDQNHIPGIDLTSQAVLLEPDAPSLYKADGTLNWAPTASGSSTWNNPLANIVGTDYIYTSKSLVSNANLSYNILTGLDISSNFGYTSLQNDLYKPTRLEVNPPEQIANNTRTAVYEKRNMSSWIIEPQLRYQGQISNGKIEGLLGSTFQQNSNDLWDISGSGYANDQLMKSIKAATSSSLNSYTASYRYNALFGRLNYNWDKKYIINLTARRDGSSRFGDNNKFHNFWSTGLGWIFSEEKWIQRHIPILSFGKLRASCGTTGNDQIPDYQYLSTYAIFNAPIPYQNSSSLVVGGIPNPYLQWEETKKWQGGIDLGFVHDRVALGVTYAKNESSNQLIFYKLPAVTGFSTIFENFPATIRNTSWEFTVNTVNVKTHNLSWTSSVNLTIPTNKLVSFPNIASTSYASGTNGIIVGQPLGIQKLYPYAGVDPATGKYLVFDTLGKAVSGQDGVIQNVLVKGGSRYYGGFSNSISYKGFQLDFTFQFVRTLGTRDMYYNTGNGRLPGSFTYRDLNPSNEPVTLLNRWQEAGDNSEFAKFSSSPFAFKQWFASSDVFYSYDASYIRLKNLSLSWKLPNKFIQKAKLQNCVFYFRGQNLITITKYSGLDPETKSINTLPPLQMWTVGIRVEL